MFKFEAMPKQSKAHSARQNQMFEEEEETQLGTLNLALACRAWQAQ